jgi:hypothetical protein
MVPNLAQLPDDRLAAALQSLMPELLLGPLHRYGGTDDATVWVETDGPCEVELRPEGAPAARERTITVAGHHYALVRATGLPENAATPYEVALDGVVRWPPPGSQFPPSFLRTHSGHGPLKIAFGSCRVCAPHEPPYTLRKDEDDRGREVDATRALALRMQYADPADWPHALLMLGDQVYADEVSPATREFIRSRRDPEVPPGEDIADFEEYTHLYREAWGEPVIRWLLSTVPTAMIFDDHDVRDDWNTSADWVRRMRGRGWWDRRITGGFMSYWLYQHWGNLSPEHLAQDDIYLRARAAGDATALFEDFGFRADRDVSGTRWSFCRDLGATRVVMMDSRAGRMLEPGARSMVDPREWAWIVEHARGGFDHVLLGTSLPLFLSPALHHLEAWNEAVCDGAWGTLASHAAERMRRGLDLEHWAAFHDSFTAMCEHLRAVAAGEHGEPPASIVALSGDVHHAYLAEVGFAAGSGARAPVWQAVCSPFRNPLDGNERRAIKAAWTPAATFAARALSRAAGVPSPPVRWRLAHDEPWFDNQVAHIEIDGRAARFVLEKAGPEEERADHLRLDRTFEHTLG